MVFEKANNGSYINSEVRIKSNDGNYTKFHLFPDLGNVLYNEETKNRPDTLPAIMMVKAIEAPKKFIDLRHIYLKKVMNIKKVELLHMSSKNCRAELFTKALQRQHFEDLR